MHEQRTVDAALALADQGLTATAIATQLAIPRATVSDWLAGRQPRAAYGPDRSCAVAHNFLGLPPAYVYLFGLWLGDGCLTMQTGRVPKLRLALDAKYPGIIAEARSAIEQVRGVAGGALLRPRNCVEVYSYWRHWPCFIPQHGPGKRHERHIALETWQNDLVARWPELLLRGLLHADGSRFMNTGTAWRAPRYAFKQVSADIRAIFCEARTRLGLRFTQTPHTVYVSRQADVAVLAS